MRVVAVALGICRLSAARVMAPVSTIRTNTCMACSLFMDYSCIPNTKFTTSLFNWLLANNIMLSPRKSLPRKVHERQDHARQQRHFRQRSSEIPAPRAGRLLGGVVRTLQDDCAGVGRVGRQLRGPR